ncbi:hypothetical protein QBC38DRAFT_471464 [Podospora fimiseda]|uniref:Uncharacterized protein n=1 Tax=Podospora fimiseda TaxID=252190 RepID=A0AAN7GYL4_9PEZI|nr:hypothetical protein QBC38DRAFT_471464 [Podospora fimiseda]
MSTNVQAARVSGRRRSSALRSSLDQQVQQQQSGRRRSSAIRRYTRNVENFNRNRAAEVVRRASQVVPPPPPPRRMRTRSMARVDEEEASTVQNESAAQWQPSIAIGSRLWLEGEDPSTIEIADRKVIQTRLWATHYQGVARFAEMLEEAIQERAQLDEKDQVNTKPRSTLPSVHTKAINQRLVLLQHILQSSQFPPESQNIQAAISGYQTGSIPYSSNYTIIYAGRIVDTFPDYTSFSSGTSRSTLLNNYFSTHGPGWLWYEPPLKGNHQITAKRSATLINPPSVRKGTQNTGHYTIRLGFQRRQMLVSRDGINFLTDKHRRVQSEPSPESHIVYYETLLDCGATHPLIWTADLPCLQIDPRRYAAQTAQNVHIAAGEVKARSYDVTTFIFPFPTTTPPSHQTGPQTFYHPTTPSYPPPSTPGPPTWPTEPNIIQSLSPLLVFPGSSATDFDPDSTPDRLSGFIPFNALYISSTPGEYKLTLGEDRRDVIGATRTPGHIRYRNDVYLASKHIRGPQLLPGHPPWLNSRYINPTPRRVIFEHEFIDGTGRVLRDEDGDDDQGVGGKSILVVGKKGTKFEELDPRGGVKDQQVHVIEPRKLDSQKDALREWKEENKRSGGSVNVKEKKGKGKNVEEPEVDYYDDSELSADDYY